MVDYTTQGVPYPEASDPIGTLPDTTKELAEWLEPRAPRNTPISVYTLEDDVTISPKNTWVDVPFKEKILAAGITKLTSGMWQFERGGLYYISFQFGVGAGTAGDWIIGGADIFDETESQQFGLRSGDTGFAQPNLIVVSNLIEVDENWKIGATAYQSAASSRTLPGGLGELNRTSLAIIRYIGPRP